MLTSLAHWIQDQVAAHGLWAVFVLMVLESACIPIPSEVTMIYAGYLVSQGDMVFWQAVLVGAFANLVGSWIAWGVGAYGVDSAISAARATTAGTSTRRTAGSSATASPVVFFARMRADRAHVHLAAGRGGADAARTVLGADVPGLPARGACCWSAIGDAAGANWETWHQRLGYLDYLVVAACWWRSWAGGYCDEGARSAV